MVEEAEVWKLVRLAATPTTLVATDEMEVWSVDTLPGRKACKLETEACSAVTFDVTPVNSVTVVAEVDCRAVTLRVVALVREAKEDLVAPRSSCVRPSCDWVVVMLT
jgi:hypothetical protein